MATLAEELNGKVSDGALIEHDCRHVGKFVVVEGDQGNDAIHAKVSDPLFRQELARRDQINRLQPSARFG